MAIGHGGSRGVVQCNVPGPLSIVMSLQASSHFAGLSYRVYVELKPSLGATKLTVRSRSP
jgi:hypothetical protein